MYLPIYDEAHHLLAHTHLQFLDASLQLTRATTEAGIAPCTVTPHLSSLAFIALAYAINPKPGTLDPQPSTLNPPPLSAAICGSAVGQFYPTP